VVAEGTAWVRMRGSMVRKRTTERVRERGGEGGMVVRENRETRELNCFSAVWKWCFTRRGVRSSARPGKLPHGLAR